MLRILRRVLLDLWIDIKIQTKVRFIYPFTFKDSEIKSIIPSGLFIDKGVSIGKNVMINNKVESIGRHTYISNDVQLIECSKVGSFTSISQGVRIGLNNHSLSHIGTRKLFYQPKKGWTNQLTWDEKKEIGYVEIGHDVLISTNVLILGGIKIGNGAVIGAGAVVTKDVPPYSIVVGVPGKIIGKRFSDEICNKLSDSKWWNLPDEVLIHNNESFPYPEEFLLKINKLSSES